MERRVGLGLIALFACADETPAFRPRAPPTTDGAQETDDGGDPTEGLARCYEPPPPGSPDPGETTGATDGGFRFDVGAPPGDVPALPPTCAEVASTQTNLGCEFWAVDLPNDWMGTPSSPAAQDQQFSIVVANTSALEPAEVSIFVGGEPTTPLLEATVEIGATHTFELEPHNLAPDRTSADGTGFNVRSTVPIVAYQFNPLDNLVEVYSNDASLLLPAHALGDDHLAATGDGVLLADGLGQEVWAGAYVAVVATADDTTVDVFPTVDVLPGLVRGVVLQRGQVLTVVSDASRGPANLSGTRIRADARVAVFAGNVATVEPIDDPTVCCADHLEHQLTPIGSWGNQYAVAPPPRPGTGDDAPAVYRMTGAFENTWLEYCPHRPPGAPIQLDARETVTFSTSLPFAVTSYDPEKPFGVAAFLQSTTSLGDSGLGDPAMIVLPAAAQMQSHYVFAVPEGYVEHWATIVRRGRGSVWLDGDAIATGRFDPLGVIDHVMHTYVHVPLEAGTHELVADSEIGIVVVGYDSWVSYGFAGGTGLRVISPSPPAG